MTDAVVLLHGLGRTSYSMSALEKTLKKEGYLVVNNSYPSRKKSISELSSVVGDGISACKKLNAKHIHFVTHSLGGILVRQYFQSNVVPEARRVVMLGPPNQGSEVSSNNNDKWWYKLFTGPAGQELGVEVSGVPNQLKAIQLEIGVIAGTKSLDPWFSAGIPKPNDGKVSLASTKLAEMKDFISVPHSHTFMANADIVSKQVKLFLSQGAFNHEI
ncbi:MAG: alpha/beta hydrolase [Cycloclasticus sp.]